MDKTFWVIDGKLAGRPGPIMEPWVPREFKSMGFTLVVSADDRCDSEELTKVGLKHLKAFMPPYFPTTDTLVAEFLRVLGPTVERVVAAVQTDETVLVHCYAGRDRTGLILCGSLMVLEGLSMEQAVAKVRSVQPLGLSSPGILNVLKEYAKRGR